MRRFLYDIYSGIFNIRLWIRFFSIRGLFTEAIGVSASRTR